MAGGDGVGRRLRVWGFMGEIISDGPFFGGVVGDWLVIAGWRFAWCFVGRWQVGDVTRGRWGRDGEAVASLGLHGGDNQ